MSDRASFGHKQVLLGSLPLWAYSAGVSVGEMGFENLMVKPASFEV
jgi:hypothetical protein